MKSYIKEGIEIYKDDILNKVDSQRNDDINDMINNNIFNITEETYDNCYTNLSHNGLLVDLLVQPRRFYDKASGTNIITEEKSFNNVVYFQTKKEKYYRRNQTFRENKIIENRFGVNRTLYDLDMNLKAYDRSRFMLIIDGKIRNDDAGFTCLDGYVYFRFRQEQKFTSAILVEFMNHNTVIYRNPQPSGTFTLLSSVIGSEYSSYKLDIIDDSGEIDHAKISFTTTQWDINPSYVHSSDTLIIAFEDDTSVTPYKWKKLEKGRYRVPANEKYYTWDVLAHDGTKYYIDKIKYINERVVEVPNTVLLPYKQDIVIEDRHISNLEDVAYNIHNAPIKPMLPHPDLYNRETSLGEYIKLNNDPNSLLLNKVYGYNRYGYTEDEVKGTVNHVIDYEQDFNLEYKLKPINTPIVRSILGKVPSGVKIYTISDYNDEIKPTIFFKSITNVDREVTVVYTLEDADNVFTDGEIQLLDYNGINVQTIIHTLSVGTNTFNFTAPDDGAYSLYYHLNSSIGENFDTSNTFSIKPKVPTSLAIDQISTNYLEVTTDITITDLDHLYISGVLEILDSQKNVIGSRPIRISDTGHDFTLSQFGTYYARYHIKIEGNPDLIVESRPIILSALDNSIVKTKVSPIINNVDPIFNTNSIIVNYGFDDPDNTFASAIITTTHGLGTYPVHRYGHSLIINVPPHINDSVSITLTITDINNKKVSRTTAIHVDTDTLLTLNNIITTIGTNNMSLTFNIDDPDASFVSGTITGNHGIKSNTITKVGVNKFDYPLPTVDEVITLDILIHTTVGSVLEHARFNVVVSNNPPVITLFKETLTNNALTVEYEYTDVSDTVTGGDITLSNNMGTKAITDKKGQCVFIIPNRIHRTVTTSLVLNTVDGTSVAKKISFEVDTRFSYEVEDITASSTGHSIRLNRVIIIDNDIPYTGTTFEAELLDYNRQPLNPVVKQTVDVTATSTLFNNVPSGRYIVKVDVGGEVEYSNIVNILAQDFTLSQPVLTLNGRDLLVSNIFLNDIDNIYTQSYLMLEVVNVDGKSLTPHITFTLPKTSNTHVFSMSTYGQFKVKVSAGNKAKFTDAVTIDKVDYTIKTPVVSQHEHTVGLSNIGIIDPEHKFTGTDYTVEVLRDTGEELTPHLIQTLPISHTSASFTIPTFGSFQFKVTIGNTSILSTVFSTGKRHNTVIKPNIVVHNRNVFVSGFGILDPDDYFNGDYFDVELIKIANGIESIVNSKNVRITESTTSFDIAHSGEYLVRVVAGTAHSDSDKITIAHQDATIDDIQIVTLSNKLTAYDLTYTPYDDIIDNTILSFDVELLDLSGNSVGVTGSFLYRDNTVTLTAPVFPNNILTMSYKLKIYSKMFPLIDPFYKVVKLTKTTPRISTQYDTYDDGNIIPANIIIEDVDNYVLNNRIVITITKHDGTYNTVYDYTLNNSLFYLIMPTAGIYDIEYKIDGTSHTDTVEVLPTVLKAPMHVSEIPLIDIRDYIYNNQFTTDHIFILRDMNFIDTGEVTVSVLDVNSNEEVEGVTYDMNAIPNGWHVNGAGLYKLKFVYNEIEYISNTFIVN